MKRGQVWSEDLTCYVSRSFVPAEQTNKQSIKLDMHKCEIIITPDGYYNLILQGRMLKRLSFNEFMKYKKHVKQVYNNCLTGDHWRN